MRADRSSSMDEERLELFLRSMDEAPLSGPLADLRREALDADVPIIRLGTCSLMRTLLMLKKPAHILEIGTAVGFSALFMLENSDADVTTIEDWPPRIAAARENFTRFGAWDRVRLLEGDATELLPGLQGPFDFIFMDAAKGQYLRYLPEVLRLMPSGAVLLADNVFLDGTVIESRFAVERRDRPIHKRMRAFLHAVTHSEDLVTTILPVGDGMTLSVRR